MKEGETELSGAQKAKQDFLAKMWKAAAQGPASTPNQSRAASAARVRKVDEITPEKQQNGSKK